MGTEFQSQYFTVRLDLDDKTGKIIGEYWEDSYGKASRPQDLPAVIHYCVKTGNPIYRAWFNDGVLHREFDKPATIATCDETGIDFLMSWAINGKTHREGDRPTSIELDPETGNTIEIQFEKNDQWHRKNGPAILKFEPKTGALIEAEYWLNGVRTKPPHQSIPPVKPP